MVWGTEWTGDRVAERLAAVFRELPKPRHNWCKNVTPVTGVWGLASAPEQNRRFRILSVEWVSKWEAGRLQDHIRFAPIARSRWLTSGEGPGRGTWVKHNRNAQPR
jgi:hypothetical protein